LKIKFIVLFASLIFSASANAKFFFGTDESLRVVTDVNLEGPEGEDLQLSRLIIRENLLLPYKMKDGGYVLTVKGKRDTYFNLPEASELEKIQNAGLLPKPLPEWEFSTLDIVFGYALWVTIGFMLVWAGIRKVFKKT
jgi:hypothetical protein